MAWQDEMVILLRTMVWDLLPPQSYTDNSLQTVLVVAAQLVIGDGLDFRQSFVPDVPNQDISPDPTDRDGGSRDDFFVDLVSMRAAAIIDQGIVRQQSGIVIRDNGSLVDLHYKLQAALDLLTAEGGWMKLYEKRKLQYQAGLLTGDPVGQAVMGPFRAYAYGVMGWDWGLDYDWTPRTGDGFFA